MRVGGHGHGRMRGSIEENDERRGKLYDHKVVRRFASYVRPNRKTAAISLVSMLVYTFTTVGQPWIIKLAVDSLINVYQEKTLGNLVFIVGLFSLNAFVNFLANYVYVVSLSKVSQQILFSLRTQMFNHLQNLSIRFFDRNEVGRIMSRAQNDVNQLQEFFNMVLITVADSLALIGIVVALFLMDAKLAIITLSVIPILLLVLLVWRRFAWDSFMEVRRAISAVNGMLQENISGVRIIQSLNRESANYGEFRDLNFKHFTANMYATRLSGVLNPIVEILTAISIVLVVFIGGIMVTNATLNISVVIAFILYIQRFFDPIRGLTNQYTGFQRAMTSGVRIFNLLDTEIEVKDPLNPKPFKRINGTINLENIHFHYTPEIPIIRGLTLNISEGETIALVGTTGAGKTTLASLITRFYDVTQGKVILDGHDIREIPQSILSRHMAMVPQEPFLFSQSITSNIKFNRISATTDEIIEASTIVNAHEFIQKLPLGYDTILQERGQNLSLGERQLISFARAILADPKILILDEATANIDSHTEYLIQRALRRILSNRTSIVIAHRLSTIRGADRIIVLDHGLIAEQGTHEELMTKGKVYGHLYKKYFSLQEN